MREVTLMLVDEDAGKMHLAVGQGKTLVAAIDAASLAGDPGAGQFQVGAIFPGRLDRNGVREWLDALLKVADE